MFLCDQSIQTLVNTRQMIIEPFDIKLLRPASYILRLSDSFSKVVKSTEIVDPICMETWKRNANMSSILRRLCWQALWKD